MLRAIFRNAGIHPRRLLSAIRGWQRYRMDRKAFHQLDTANDWCWGRELPILTEWNESSGSLGAYFFQDQIVARWILEAKPERHVDVGSRLDGFVGHLSVFRMVEVIDIRPQPIAVPNVTFHQLDLMNPIPGRWTECTDSLSCLHTIEHFGLGRYGDPVNPNGHLEGLKQLKKMVAPGGTFYLSTPIGPQRVEFNAHRVTAPATLIGWFQGDWEILRSAVIDDNCRVTESDGAAALRNATCNLGVGILAAKRVR